MPDPNEGDAPTTPVTQPAPATEPAAAAQPAAAGGQAIPSKTKNAIIAGGIGLAVGFGLLGFGAGYVVGDSGSSTTQQQFPGGGNGQFPGGGMNGGGMNGQLPGGGGGQLPGQQNGQIPNGPQVGQTPNGQTAAPTQSQPQSQSS
ncbi:hypothetical protein [Gordonia polyisoprenivorans]|uniref:hypothetical protein n=1 Tax=Gordonia polyisoprenivorans TaxID=84595 RepID=UPI001FCBD126|nr:hypothetical protein [Gordonia polyisoprenivorans]